MNYLHTIIIAGSLGYGLSLTACTVTDAQERRAQIEQNAPAADIVSEASTSYDEAIFAGGCFWCVESDFEKLDGVSEVISGYSGADLQNPTYQNHGQHLEVAKIIFDPSVVSYKELLDYYWVHIDPTDPLGQFCDKGNAYKTAIYARPDQIATAQASLAEIKEKKPFTNLIVTPVLEAKTFWDAEDYHQDYYKKNPVRYQYYRTACRRDAIVKALWGDFTL